MFLYSRLLEVQTHFVITAMKFLWILHQLIKTEKHACTCNWIYLPAKKQTNKKYILVYQ